MQDLKESIYTLTKLRSDITGNIGATVVFVSELSAVMDRAVEAYTVARPFIEALRDVAANLFEHESAEHGSYGWSFAYPQPKPIIDDKLVFWVHDKKTMDRRDVAELPPNLLKAYPNAHALLTRLINGDRFDK